MKTKIKYIAITLTIIVLVTAVIFVACKKTNDIQQFIKMTQEGAIVQSEMIPIAKLSGNNEIEHLFLQKDAQRYFLQSTNAAKLVFIEVIDNEKNGKELGLLYRIHDEDNNIKKTSIISSVLTLKGDVYYYAPPAKGDAKGTTCTTSDCPEESQGCAPKTFGGCTPCANKGKCTRTTGSLSVEEIIKLTDAIRNAVSVY